MASHRLFDEISVAQGVRRCHDTRAHISLHLPTLERQWVLVTLQMHPPPCQMVIIQSASRMG
jgi:hypothetical protein